MALLAFLFIVVPAVELALLIEVGSVIGGLNTFVLIVVTGMVGAYLAKRQGLDVLKKVQGETAAGRLPTGSLVDGAILLVASALLVTPGILTDVVGFACLIPAFRSLVKGALKRKFESALVNGQVNVGGQFPGAVKGPGGASSPFSGWPQANPGANRAPYGDGPVVDVTPEPPSSERR